MDGWVNAGYTWTAPSISVCISCAEHKWALSGPLNFKHVSFHLIEGFNIIQKCTSLQTSWCGVKETGKLNVSQCCSAIKSLRWLHACVIHKTLYWGMFLGALHRNTHIYLLVSRVLPPTPSAYSLNIQRTRTHWIILWTKQKWSLHLCCQYRSSSWRACSVFLPCFVCSRHIRQMGGSGWETGAVSCKQKGIIKTMSVDCEGITQLFAFSLLSSAVEGNEIAVSV